MTMNRRKKRPLNFSGSPVNNKNRFEKFSLINTTSLIFGGAIILIFFVSFYAVNDHNSIRNAIALNPGTSIAKVTEISEGKGVNFAVYTFSINGKEFTGETFNSYSGKKGDLICIEHVKDNPDINIYCEEKSPENFFDDVLIYTLKIAGIMIGFFIVAMLFNNKSRK